MNWNEVLDFKESEYLRLKEEISELLKKEENELKKRTEKLRIEYEMGIVAKEINEIEKYLKRLDYVKKVSVE